MMIWWVAKGKNQIDIRFVDLDLLCDYAAEDADITFQLKEILEKEIHQNGLQQLFYEIEMPLMKVLARMEQSGVESIVKRCDSTLLFSQEK